MVENKLLWLRLIYYLFIPGDDTSGYKVPKQGVEILLNDFNQESRKDGKKVDVAAQLKRKLNRQRKDYQQRLHKVNLIAWVEHCAFVNRKLNDTNLMSGVLKLLPKNKNHCYPTDQTDLDYFKQIVKWFKSAIGLRNTEMYCNFKYRPPILLSLALQIKVRKLKTGLNATTLFLSSSKQRSVVAITSWYSLSCFVLLECSVAWCNH